MSADAPATCSSPPCMSRLLCRNAGHCRAASSGIDVAVLDDLLDVHDDSAAAAPSGAAEPPFSAADFVTIDDARSGGYVVLCWTIEGQSIVVSVHSNERDAETARDAISRALASWPGWSS